MSKDSERYLSKAGDDSPESIGSSSSPFMMACAVGLLCITCFATGVIVGGWWVMWLCTAK